MKKDRKDFREYHHPLEFYENLRDGEANPKEVLRSQTRFKSDLNETKLGGNK